MGQPAAKHLDPVVGVDTHIILIPTPGGPVPTPIPHPYVGMLFDPMDYVPKIGSTINVNGLPRAIAGTAGTALPPHVPMGGPFAKPPSNESEMFMGSSTVIAEGEPMSYAALPVLSCQDIGIPAPPRAKKKSVAKSLMLPTTTVLPIPGGPPVLVGGSPTISLPGPEILIGPLAKGLGKALKKALKKSKRLSRKLKRLSKKLHKLADAALDKLGLKKASLIRNKVHRAICTVTGHPVDVATGKVFTDFVDFELPGPFPFKLERVWFSTSSYEGPLGHGWHASFDMALATSEHVTAVRLADGRVAVFPPLKSGASYFNPNERLTLQRDAYGHGLVDAQGWTYRFRESGTGAAPLSSIQDRNGFAIQFEHDQRGRLARIIDSGARPWNVRHDSFGRIVELEGTHPTDPIQRVVYARYAYDGHGNLSELRDALGNAQRFVYQRHLLAQELNKNGLSFYFQYDGRDETARCIRTWGDGGIYDHKLTYDGGRTVVENSLGHKTTYVHDGAMVRQVIDALGNVTKTTHDSGYRVVAEENALGQVTRHTYDERGNLTSTIEPSGAQVTIEYGPHDLPLKATDPVGGVWQWTRDERGRLLERRDPLGRTTRYQYAGPHLVGVTNPASTYTALAYDSAGNLEALGTPDGYTTRFHRDAHGRLVAVTDPKGNVQQRELDLLGRVVRVHEPDGNQRDLAHDAEGNVVRTKDQHHDVTFSYQGMGRLASRTEAGTTVRFVYDTEEQLTGIVNEQGHAYRFVLGPSGQVDEEHGFDGLMRKYTRDKLGRVVRVDRPTKRFSNYKLDVGGRVVEVSHSDGSKENYLYRIDGELLAANNSDAMVSFERDVLGRVLREKQGEHWVSSTYDALGLRVRVQSSFGVDQVIQRGAMGDVVDVDEGAGRFEARFVRDELGREVMRFLPGGVKSKWDRDAVGRPTQHTVSAEGSLLRAVGYKWEPHDRLRMVLDGLKGPTEYTHDALGNLAGATYADGTTELRMPDAVGNLFRRADRTDRQYGAAGQLLAQSTPHGEIRYAYDPEGNLIEKRESNGRVWNYEWNGAGMLAKVIRPDGTAVTFGYDALGRRVKKTYRGQTTRWVWDGNAPLHEWVEGTLEPERDPGVPFLWSADPLVKKREAELSALLSQGPPDRGTKQQPITWLFEPESFAPMAKLVGDDRFSIVTDHLGTPVLMADANGESVWQAGVSAYGELRDLRGARHVCPFRWPGQYEDLETGLYYNRFRYYDPESGQYTSQDPIGLAGGAALHAYPRDPLAWTDPLGLTKCTSTSTAIAPYWPPDRGFLGGRKERKHLMPGEMVDRYGYEGGTFVSPRGVPYPMRALPPGTNQKPYHVYRVTKPIEVETGQIEPAFGEPGMGVQHELPTSVAKLLRYGFLEEVPP
jgi:RHS repeat-associated protein